MADGAGSTNRTLLVSVYPYIFWGLGLCALVLFFALTPICVLRPPVVLLPANPHAPAFSETEYQVAVTLMANGDTFMDRRRVTRPELVYFTAQLFAARPARSFLVRADRRLSFREVRSLLTALREGGVTGVRLITQD